MDISEKLFKEALVAANNAYAPYSKYKVGAAIYSGSSKIYRGCNVENVSYPCGTCAEAGAIAAMINGNDTEIKAILVLSDSKDLVYPCGACLQRIAEFSNEETIVYLANAQKICKKYKLTTLLPYNFKAQELQHD